MKWFKKQPEIYDEKRSHLQEAKECTFCPRKPVHWCEECDKTLCQSCYVEMHYKIVKSRILRKPNRSVKSIVGNRCEFCSETFLESMHKNVCPKCSIIINYNSDDPEEFFKALNRVVELLLEKRFNINLKDEHYYEDRYGKHVDDVVKSAIQEYRRKKSIK
jgi:hypothetical protein